MKVLVVGGTGLISAACVDLAVAQGHDVWVLNRGRTRTVPLPEGVTVLTADVREAGAVAAATAGLGFDAVVQPVGFTPDQVERDMALFADVGQYVFVSSATVYRKPPPSYLVSEATPLGNPFWRYARDKIECEERLRSRPDFPATIVRPSLTYGPGQVPVCVGSWQRPYTIIDRIRRGAKIIVPGDGTSLWTVTHNTDVAKGLVGLLGNPAAIGEAVHVTSDEVLTWNQIYALLGEAVGAVPDVVHVPTDALAAADAELAGSLLGDKAYSVVFDNSKIRRLVPGFAATVPFAEGIRATVDWFDADPARQTIDEEANALWDRIAAHYVSALRSLTT